jgi:hypothetical protein
MRQRRSLLVLLLLGALIAGCAMGGAESSQSLAEDWAAPAEPMAEAPMEERAASDTGDGFGDVDLQAADQERMIIYNAELALVVQDTEATQADVVSLAEGAGGHVASADSYAYGDGLRRITLSIRVPAEAFNSTMDALREMALEVTQDSISSDDVTQEYVDLESRLTALEAKATRLEELMEQAEDTEAVLAVYEELSATQIQIEETKGRMRYLERSSSMATITVHLTPDELSQPVEIAGWRPQGTVKRAIEALIEAFQFLVDALIWFVLAIAPVLIFVGLGLYALIRLLGWIIRLLRGKGRRRKAEDQGTEPASEGK